MKRRNIEKVSRVVAEESSDSEEDIEEEQESEDGTEMDGDEEQSDVSDNDVSVKDDREMEEDEEQGNVSDNDGIKIEQSSNESRLDLAASATDSDEDDDEADQQDLKKDVEKDIKPKLSKAERIRQELVQKYQQRQGKQLYIRFPHKVAETEEALEKEVKELTPLVVKVHKPRQKHARFCLVDFATNEDRDTAFKQLKKAFSKGDLAKYVVNIPKTESQKLVSELAERKIKSIENKKAKNRLKRASKKALTENYFTSTVIVLNLPKTATAVEIRKLFPNAVDIQIKAGKSKMHKDKSIAAINLPTTMDARNAIKKKLSLGGNELIIKFDNQKMGRNKKIKIGETKTEATETEDSEPANKKAKLEQSADILKITSQPQPTLNFKAKLNPFTKSEKPFNKGTKPLDECNKEKLEPSAEILNLDSQNQPKLDSKAKINPFTKGEKPFNKGAKTFDKCNKPINRGNNPFKGNKPFNKSNKPFNKGNAHFNNVNKPLNKGSKSFHKGSNSFKKGQNNNFQNKKSKVATN